VAGEAFGSAERSFSAGAVWVGASRLPDSKTTATSAGGTNSGGDGGVRTTSSARASSTACKASDIATARRRRGPRVRAGATSRSVGAVMSGRAGMVLLRKIGGVRRSMNVTFGRDLRPVRPPRQRVGRGGVWV
jgi:hypothetical protein